MKKYARALIGLVVSALLLCAFSACASVARPLDGSQWKLVAWTLSSIGPDPYEITAEFASGGISGHSGVNTYRGDCTIGADGKIAIGRLGSTKMGGSQDAMRAEGAFTTLLAQVGTYKIADDRLTLFDKNGNESLIFESATR